MIPVAEARARLLALVAPVGAETVALRRAAGRVLAEALVARDAAPPFDASAMDGYAVRGTPAVGDGFAVVGEAAAGAPWTETLEYGEAVRIFTGAPIPAGATRVVIQEDVRRVDARIVVEAPQDEATHVRPAGGDFAAGYRFDPRRPLGPADVALAAAMGFDAVPVRRRPVVAVAMTGDELRHPGEALTPGAIRASNGYGIAAMLEAAGAEARLLPIARDRAESLRDVLALGADADLVVTVGGASVGDHDLVAEVAGDAGLDLAFHKVRMRPGKPLLAGRLGNAALVGLPGNPVSALVCAMLFVVPMVERMLGLDPGPRIRRAPLAAPVGPNGPREHYARATLTPDGLRIAERQDSSLLTVLAEADALAIRPPDDPARGAGEVLDYVPLRLV
ncbi:molybdopterin molybdotransferase MoeA [Jannaschia sp. W003]|uniref:molybdopterin molybdotransferase MoeA n=1 Tax=Jannaschia sp. W003 TaxID=2867012 RepID=UPI0021A578F4|nr:molybdopterin molybdotransferase MoeA [Jannaschia sp. W003]UWQ20273.1 molybdopterin molybdotransferase MoeA [Jannaschia sp. W003]